MTMWIKRLAMGLLAVAIAACAAALWKREEIVRLLAVQSLFEPDRITGNFSHMDAAFLSVPIKTEAGPPLPRADPVPLPPGADAWIAERRITGLVVLRNGEVTHESYHLGTGPDDLRIGWSVSKSFLSLLIGQLVANSTLKLDDPVILHAPELDGSAYDGVSLIDVLQMESGVTFDEDITDPDSDINRMGRVVALGSALDDFTAELTERDREAGGAWNYVSIDTHVLGMVVRGATGRSIPDLMAERLIGPMGIGPAYYLTDGDGVAFVLGGLNMRTIDYARMGLLVEQGGILTGHQIVPEAWVAESTAASARTPEGRARYGYQWWIAPDGPPGEVMARGLHGQYVYIDRATKVVIAVNAADVGYNAPDVFRSMTEMFRAIAAAQ